MTREHALKMLATNRHVVVRSPPRALFRNEPPSGLEKEMRKRENDEEYAANEPFLTLRHEGLCEFVDNAPEDREDQTVYRITPAGLAAYRSTQSRT